MISAVPPATGVLIADEKVTSVPQTHKDMPGSVITVIAASIAPIPFLFIYSVLFILRGTVLHSSNPPDITSTRGGEALVGLAALVFLVVCVIGTWRYLTQSGRWLLILGQLVTLGFAVDFVLDSSTGEPEVPFVLILSSATALLMCLRKTSWNWITGDPD